MNNIGPNNDPCGTPLVTSAQSDFHHSALLSAFSLLANSVSSLILFLLFLFYILCITTCYVAPCQKLFASLRKTSTGSFSSTLPNKCSVNSNRFVRQDLLFLNPSILNSLLFFSKKFTMSSFIIFSNTLQT